MNIETNPKIASVKTSTTSATTITKNEEGATFADELKNTEIIKKTDFNEEVEQEENNETIASQEVVAKSEKETKECLKKDTPILSVNSDTDKNISQQKNETVKINEQILSLKPEFTKEISQEQKPIAEEFVPKESVKIEEQPLQIKPEIPMEITQEQKPIAEEFVPQEPVKIEEQPLQIKPEIPKEIIQEQKPEVQEFVNTKEQILPKEPEVKPENITEQKPKIENFVETEENNPILTEKEEQIVVIPHKEEKDIKLVIDGLQDIVQEINKVNRPEEKATLSIKNNESFDDKEDKNEDDILINNDMNVQEPKEQLTPQMNANMNFNSDGQPFAAFVNQEQEAPLRTTEAELAEEEAILSTMSENIAIANKNIALSKTQPEKPIQKTVAQPVQNIFQEPVQEITPEVKTISNEQGIKKVDTKTNITVETVVKYDTVIMNKADVEFFTQLVENGTAEVNTQENVKSSQVSKSLADLIAKSMKDNQPVRIDFDNNISVIIKISKDGKISADFLPSSQIAEAYLKENLPILKQRFDDNNIEYDELNQRKQKQDDRNNRKKGSKDE